MLTDWLQTPERERLKRDFARRFYRICLKRRAPGGISVAAPVTGWDERPEVKGMRSETIAEWESEWFKQGVAHGALSGRRTLLLVQVAALWDAGIAEVSRPLIARIEDPSVLVALAVGILRASDSADWRAWLEAALNPAQGPNGPSADR